ncbi:hypothetical protein BDA96_03G002900 [Sorghum bicolor]|uniref:HTH myb-type domain-containing protein n=1 Tax=Sorghum bicolor TaxID=4558 RepID=A0A921R889_SORBI|nr:hypothetical protein BDA96_03G002900 [Sorghum bicolor]
MLGVSTLRSPSRSSSKADQHCGGGFVGDHHVVFPTSGGGSDCCDGFAMVDVDDNLLDYIDFSCDVPFFDADGDILPDLEVDPTELLAEFSSTPPPDDLLLVHVDDEAANNKPPVVPDDDVKQHHLAVVTTAAAQEEKQTCGGDEKHVAASKQTTTEEDYSAACAGAAVSDTKSSASAAESHSKKKAAAGNKNSHGKRKVDWTPELHRRFVQAVEQLGIDKAVPSRILEIMGMDCLTRHNIASHLQAARKWGPQAAAVTQGTPCVPPPAAMLPRFPVPGMVPHPMYRPTMVPPPPPPPPPQPSTKLAELQLELDTHPSKESIDAAIGDVLVKPWLPLPLGLKPPSLDSVMSELHKQGVPSIPPAATATAIATG